MIFLGRKGAPASPACGTAVEQSHEGRQCTEVDTECCVGWQVRVVKGKVNASPHPARHAGLGPQGAWALELFRFAVQGLLSGCMDTIHFLASRVHTRK